MTDDLLPEQHVWTMSDEARASNPGNLKIDPLRWIRYASHWPMTLLVSLVFAFALAVFLHWVFWIVTLPLLLVNWLYWRHIHERFQYGDANPGIVVAVEPTLIAVATDLTKGIGEFPVVKIIEKSVPSVCGQPPQFGSRLATVAVYESGDEELPHWADFHPCPVDIATGDQEAIQAVMRTFTDDDWNRLRTYLKQVPRPFRPGLFPIELDTPSHG